MTHRNLFTIATLLLAVTFHSMAQQPHSPMRIESQLLQESRLPDLYLLTNDSTAFRHWVNQQPVVVPWIYEGRGIYRILAEANWSSETLKRIPGVSAVDRAGRKPQEEIVLGNFDQTVNAVTSVAAHYPGTNGMDRTLSVKEKPFDISDLDLSGRIILNSQFDEPATPHATFMATIAAGAGNTSPYARGAAWAASITTSDFDRLLPDNGNELSLLNVSVQNHSYGVGLENYYGVESFAYDRQGIEYPEILHVFSSGNRGTSTPADGAYAGVTGFANLTGQFKVSKNTIAVGSADRFGEVVPLSSRGPAHDGRIKPELIAYGDAGSSEAAAIVSGISLLIQQQYEQKFNAFPDVALLKAILINSAQDTGRPHVDYETGFGNADALEALKTVNAGNFFSGIAGPGDELIFPIVVSEGNHQLKVTLVWADPPADPLSDKALVNDLDLTIVQTSSQEVWEPWVLNPTPSVTALKEDAVRGKDRLNNVEQITIDDPQAGVYEIKVSGYNMKTVQQKFHIVYQTMATGFEWRYPLHTDALRSDEKNILRWRWAGKEAVGSIFYKMESDAEWQLVGENISVKQNYVEWNAPEEQGLIQFRMKVAGNNYDTDPVAITKPERLKVGYNCDEDVMLVWRKLQGATHYSVYQLGEKYLEPLMITTDTFLIVSKAEMLSDYFSFAPVFGESTGYRESLINYNLQGTECYFISVLPRHYVTDSEVLVDVLLGTVYNLKEATFERWNGVDFLPVRKLQPVTSNRFTMQDPLPLTGTYPYRVKLETQSGLAVFSDEVRITYVSETNVFVYPNPLYGNETVSIVIDDDGEARIQLVDLNGRVLREVLDSGPEKTIDTAGLPAGSYLLRIYRRNGQVDTQKLIVVK